MSAENKASISGGKTPEEIGEFWDIHDLTDYLDQTTDVTDQLEIDIQAVRHLVALDPQLLQQAISRAHREGITVETLVNLAVKEALGRSPQR
jgi:CopG antitoxin of type II toxin-antitoxin system